MGLTGVESAKGFLAEAGLGGSAVEFRTIDRYGGGAVAVEEGRGIGSAAMVITEANARA